MELLDVLDENGNLTGRAEERKIVHEQGLWHIHVGVWIMNQKGELLFQKRSPNKIINPNKWTRTGGHVDSGETPIKGIQRETEEEIGVTFNNHLTFSNTGETVNLMKLCLQSDAILFKYTSKDGEPKSMRFPLAGLAEHYLEQFI